jgi:hypothetical protein
MALKARYGMSVELDFFSEKICCDMYKENELIDTEMEMLMALTWKLNGPCPHDFIEYIVELVLTQEDESIKSSLILNAKSISASSMMDFSEAQRLPSSIAVSSLIESIEELQTLHPCEKLQLACHISSLGSDIVTRQKQDVVVTNTYTSTAESIASFASQVAGRSFSGYCRMFNPSA